jgi:hypothetical protein
MLERHQANHDRLDACLMVVQNTTDIRAKSTIWKFYNNCRIVWTELDKEMVNCRRQQRITLKYEELEAKLLESIHTFEQWAMMAALMY